MNYQTPERPKENIGGEGMEHSSAEKMNKALALLNEVAKEKKEELNQLISERYSNIKEMMDEATESFKETLEKTKQNLGEAMASGEKKLKEMSVTLDKRIHDNPWTYLALTAVGFFLYGIIIGGSGRSITKYK